MIARLGLFGPITAVWSSNYYTGSDNAYYELCLVKIV